MNTQKENHIIEIVNNYLRAQNLGALLITGSWGCGKTYFFKNVLKDALKKNKPEHLLVMVSLFGIHNLNEIPNKIFYAFIDSFGKDNIKINAQHAIEGFKHLLSYIPKVNEYIDVEKISFLENKVYRVLPKDEIVICFDDLERIDRSIPLNEILGTINDLVENLGFKVIIITNEEYLREREKEEEDKIKNEIFKEKVIYKTISFIPDTFNIFRNIITSYNDKRFTDFMNKPFVLDSINPNNKTSRNYKDYKNDIINIRNLKFAIDHFYDVFKDFKNNNYSDEDIKLKSYWYFILGIAIDYKNNRISFENDHGLRSYVYENVVNFEEGNNINHVFTNDCENRNKSVSDNNKFCKNFYNKYFLEVNEYPIFHNELYNFITAGITYDSKRLDNEFNYILENRKNKINNAEKLFKEFDDGTYKFTNDDAYKKIHKLLLYVNKGELKDVMSYINSFTYLFKFKELLEITEEELIKKVENGIDIFTSKLEYDPLMKRNLSYTKEDLPDKTLVIYNYIINKIDEIENIQIKDYLSKLENCFLNNMKDFKEIIVDQDSNHINTYHISILKNFNEKYIEQKLSNMEPNDVILLNDVLVYRYSQDSNCVYYFNDEISFIKKINNTINKLNLKEKKLSNILIKNILLPTLDKFVNKKK